MSEPIRKLTFVAICGLWACGGMLYFYDIRVSSTILKSTFSKEAMKLLKRNEGAKLFLGEPIMEVSACFNGSPNEMKVNVVGSKSKGIVFLSLQGENENCFLDSVQLQIGKDESKRLMIKEPSNKTIAQ